MLNLYKLGRGKRAEDKKDGDEKPAGVQTPFEKS